MYDIITIGTATRDIFLTPSAKKISFPTGEAQCFVLGAKIEVNKPVFATGGGATNTAVTFSRQGLKVATLIKLGQDESADYVLQELKKEKIIPLAVQEKNKTTAFSVILLAPSGERTILVYRGASSDLKIKDIPFEKLKSSWAYISPGDISFSVIEKLFNYFSENKTLIAFNPSKYYLDMGIKKLKPLFAKAKVVILNREEAAYLSGINYKKEKEIFQKLDKITPGIAVMTDGRKGVLVSDGLHLYSAGIFKEKVIDRTGAGDAFGSGFVAGLIQKKENCEKGLCQIHNIKHAIRLGSANATSVIAKIGAKAGILNKSEFEKSKRWQKLKISKISKL